MVVLIILMFREQRVGGSRAQSMEHRTKSHQLHVLLPLVVPPLSN